MNNVALNGVLPRPHEPAREGLFTRAGMAAATFVIGAFALAMFAILLGCALATEAWGRFRHGKHYEAGGGIGSSEDYS